MLPQVPAAPNPKAGLVTEPVGRVRVLPALKAADVLPYRT